MRSLPHTRIPARFLRLRLPLGRPPLLRLGFDRRAPLLILLLPPRFSSFFSCPPGTPSAVLALCVASRRGERAFRSGSRGAPDMRVEGLEDAGRLDQDIDKHAGFVVRNPVPLLTPLF